ncbi:MAG: helix-turn-helix transcriptional regulator [Clostridia bacterium]|nr:helix-turn-helix transcriptional regulator [Clostridia bacterium]
MLTKVEIARKTGLSRVTISNVLNNKQKNPKVETLEKISNALNCSMEELRRKIKEG